MVARRAVRTFALVAALTGLGAGPIAPLEAQYVFQRLARTGGFFDPFGFGSPALNNRGQVAFNAIRRGDRDAIYRAGPGGLTRIAIDNGFFRFGNVSINGVGEVGFEGSFDDGEDEFEGIFRGSGGPVTRIAATVPTGDFDFVNAGPSINAAGRVAFIGERIVDGDFVDGVWAGDGGAVDPIVDTSGPFEDFTGNPALNDAGVAAFTATLDGGGQGLFVGSGGGFALVADESGLLTNIFGFSGPSINEAGAVAFRAGTNPDFEDNSGSTGVGIFLYRDGALTTVVQGEFDTVADLGDPSLNNVGEVAFIYQPDFFSQILVAGSDPVRDRVIGTGDVLFGRTVAGIRFAREGFNDRGQLAFTAVFEDGSEAIVRATPRSIVPEPATVALVAFALPLLGLVARRRMR